MIRHTDTDWREEAISIASIIVMLGVVALVASSGAIGTATAQTNNTSTPPPYYDNASNATPSGWLDNRQEPTLVNVSAMLTRVGTFIIGTGGTTQGGGGPAGVIVFGLTVLGVVLGVVRGSSVGSVGGSVVVIAAAAVIVSVGLAPMWLYAVILFGVGIVAATAILRAL